MLRCVSYVLYCFEYCVPAVAYCCSLLFFLKTMAVFFRFLYVHDGHRVLSERSVDGPGLNVDLPFSFRLRLLTSW